jgi:hypothetical protein
MKPDTKRVLVRRVVVPVIILSGFFALDEWGKAGRPAKPAKGRAAKRPPKRHRAVR